MTYPVFFDQVRKITLYDPLAEFLGASTNGLIEYTYTDAVNLAGHSCPTVAGAYLMTVKALYKLFDGSIPERGAVKVQFKEDATKGVTGVIANVVGLITGATQETGFKGIAGKFDRRNLMSFNAGINDDICFVRMDTGACVAMQYHPDIVPPMPETQELMQKFLSGNATAEEMKKFRELWQVRVKRILIDHFDDPEMVKMTFLPAEKNVLAK